MNQAIIDGLKTIGALLEDGGGVALAAAQSLVATLTKHSEGEYTEEQVMHELGVLAAHLAENDAAASEALRRKFATPT